MDNTHFPMKTKSDQQAPAFQHTKQALCSSSVAGQLPDRSSKPHRFDSLSSAPSLTSASSGTPSAFSNRNVKTNSSANNNSSRSKLSQWMSDWVTDWWGAELACWTISALSLVAIVVLLESHKSQPLPKWPLKLTINSLISVFATVGQMAMMKPVVEAISQLKWLWFIRKEKLVDFQVFDDASRGPTGSLLLLGKLRFLHLASLGAAVTVLSIAFTTFAQQVVTYPLRPHPDGNAIATTSLVLNYTAAADIGIQESPQVLSALYSGLSNSNSSLSDVSSSCSTGDCTWPIYPSLGICASVIDVSADIENNRCNVTAFEEVFKAAGLENPGYPCFNHSLPYTVPEVTITTSGDSLDREGNASLSDAVPLNPIGNTPSLQILSLGPTAGNDSSLVTAYVIYQPEFENSLNSSVGEPIAYSLSLDLCVQMLNTTVANGITYTSIVSSQIITKDGLDIEPNSTALSVDGFDFGIMTFVGLSVLSNTIQGFFTENCYMFLNETAAAEQFVLNGDSICIDAIGPYLLGALQSSDPLSSVTKVIGSIATSLTNMFRTGAAGDSLLAEFQGTAFSTQSFIKTDYTWLILPLSLVSLTLVFLLATITKSKRLGSRVWKSSNMATLQGLHMDLHQSLGGLTSISEMDEKGNSVKVRFNMEHEKAEHGAEYRLVESKRESFWKG